MVLAVAGTVALVGCKPKAAALPAAPPPAPSSNAPSGVAATPAAQPLEAANAALEKGDLLGAARLTFRERDLHPERPEPYLLLGVIYSRMATLVASRGEAQEAVSALERARQNFRKSASLAPQSAAPLLNLARLEMEAQRPLEGLKVLQQAARAEPKNAEVWFTIGRAQRQRGSHGQSTEAFRRAAELDPARPEPHLELGMVHMDYGRYGQARQAFEEAHRLGNRSPLVLSALALSLLVSPDAAGQVSRAESLLTEAGNPDIPPAVFARGLLLQQKGDAAGAAALFQRILAADPRNERALFSLAGALRTQGDRAKAAEILKRYQAVVARRQLLASYGDRIRRAGPSPELLRGYARALMEGGFYAQAEAQFRQLQQKQPGDAEAARGLKAARAALSRRAPGPRS